MIVVVYMLCLYCCTFILQSNESPSRIAFMNCVDQSQLRSLGFPTCPLIAACVFLQTQAPQKLVLMRPWAEGCKCADTHNYFAILQYFPHISFSGFRFRSQTWNQVPVCLPFVSLPNCVKVKFVRILFHGSTRDFLSTHLVVKVTNKYPSVYQVAKTDLHHV